MRRFLEFRYFIRVLWFVILLVIYGGITLWNNVSTKIISQSKVESYVKESLFGPILDDFQVEKVKGKYQVSFVSNRSAIHLYECSNEAGAYTYLLLIDSSEAAKNIRKNISNVTYECKEDNATKYYVQVNNFNNITKNEFYNNFDNLIVFMNQNKERLNTSFDQEAENYKNYFKGLCDIYDYNTLIKNPDNYFKAKIKYIGKVTKIIQEGSSGKAYLVNVVQNEYGYNLGLTHVWFKDLDDSEEEIKLFDLINFYGVVDKPYTYEIHGGKTTEIPSINIKYFDKNNQ